MGRTHRLQHDAEVAQRVTLAALADLVLAAFVVIAAAVTIYDIGKWLTVW